MPRNHDLFEKVKNFEVVMGRGTPLRDRDVLPGHVQNLRGRGQAAPLRKPLRYNMLDDVWAGFTPARNVIDWYA